MTKPAPARLIGYFAKSAPVCIILRRGPSRYTLMIKWHTDTDVFEVGQWIRGKVNSFSMTSTGTHAAIGIMGGISRKTDENDDGQHAVVCRPPYFSALEIKFGGLCCYYFTFDPDDHLDATSGGTREVHAEDSCPFLPRSEHLPWNSEHPSCRSPFIDATKGPARGNDQSGREIIFDSGKIFAIENGEPRLLFDTNPLKFTPVEPPAWALTWNEMPGDHI